MTPRPVPPNPARRRIPVAVLGATGAAGQGFVRLLAEHPWFELAAVAVPDHHADQSYGEAVRWRETTPLPDAIARRSLGRCDPFDVPIAFSALDDAMAGPIEEAFARAGTLVVTTASAHRMNPVVPLVMAEVNPDHVDLLTRQRQERGWRGGIVAIPNCAAAGLVMALAPLHRAFGVERVFVTTMQAVSGAGYPGVASLDILGNVIPFIGNEEEKLERETRKLLGEYASGVAREARIVVSAHANRVPVEDGHTASVSVGLSRRATPADAERVVAAYRPAAAVAGLLSTPERPIELERRPDRPQPIRDRDRGLGMTVTVGRMRACPLLDLRFTVLSHNRIRGAAGGAIQLGELLVAQGIVA